MVCLSLVAPRFPSLIWNLRFSRVLFERELFYSSDAIAILQYIYCNEVELDEQLALDLIPVVDEYVMKGLKGLCEKYLCKQLRKDNVVDMLIVADRHEIEELEKVCFKFILKNLDNIDENEEMMKLSKSLFIELLKFSIPDSQQKSSLWNFCRSCQNREEGRQILMTDLQTQTQTQTQRNFLRLWLLEKKLHQRKERQAKNL